jgi:hypothetical protein
MDFPTLRSAHVDSFGAYPHPVIGIFGKFVNATDVRRSCRQCQKLVKPQGLDIPTDLAEIEVAVVI